ncbi:TCR/Tet family MFS transporter [Chitinophaga nivalis]|uniref:TCR/Tet family MFS transporter n=1 Tax=Chitinophaga nivalis TaxID=2991709 RepID=A0ABT3IGZ8_9BACT|nr:TCR/Tet family MFS transporter [Chitinophaga nivalis]MCW3467088.1 TCR/Tet family MFS transporter [Chitinophaga nivalis]MCW3483221.1 TCR/Tet family MFS transporter [Chitinophaga nivalis]
MTTHQRSVVVFITLTVLIDTAGLGIIFPVLPGLIARLGHTDISTAASYGGWLSFVYAAMQFVFAPVLGNLSDAWGRRPVLLCSLLGFSLDYLLLAFAPNLYWLFIGRTISGITGASYVTGATYMADISTGDDRTKNFGILNAAMGIGFIVGPALGGLLGQYGTHLPFIATAALGLLNFILGYFVLPESLVPANRRPFSWKKANPLGALQHLRQFPGIRWLLAAILCLSFAQHSMETIWSYFTIQKFGWTIQLIGLSLGILGVLYVLSQAWLVGRMLTRLKDTRTAFTGLIFTCAAFLCFALCSWQGGLFIGILLMAIGSVAETALQGMLSNQTPASEQGALQGSAGALKGIITVIAPPFLAHAFAVSTGQHTWFYFPGMPFLIAAAAVLLSIVLLRKNSRTPPVTPGKTV